MAITRAPLMGFSASGQVGKSLVFGTWKGQKYARSYVIPANPKTTKQTTQRDLFQFVHDVYKYMGAFTTDAWKAYAKGKMLTPANAWASKNIINLKGKANNNDLLFIPAVLGAPPNQGITVTPGATQLTVVGVPPALPTGWTITDMIAVVTKQYTSMVETEPVEAYEMTKAVAPWSVVFTGLTTAQVYVVGVGWKVTRADTQIAYGSSTQTTGTPT